MPGLPGTTKEKCLSIIRSYIQMLNTGTVREWTRQISKEEAGELAIPLLEAVAADIEAALPE